MKKLSFTASWLAIFGMLTVACAPAAIPATAPTTAPPKLGTPPAKAAAAPSPTIKPASTGPQSGGVLTISHFADPASYDPIQEATLQAGSLVAPNYSGLVQHDPLEPTKVIGDLAEKWDLSQDGKTYTFSLHKGVKWHDGAHFTSEDARFSLELTRQPPRGIVSPQKDMLKAVTDIQAPDPNTLKITLSYPSASFLHNLGDGRLLIIPKHVFEAKGNLRRDIVGTGAYKFKAHNAGASFSVAKNPDYFIKGRPYLDGITWFIIPDTATRFAALRTHRVQITPFASQGLTPSQSEIIKRELADSIVVQNYPSLIFYSFWMPHKRAPWSDLRLRRAVELAIDRQKVIKVAVESVGDIGGFTPPGVWSLPEAELMSRPGYRQPKDADIAEAKRIMAEAGYAQGIKTTTVTRNVPQLERATTSLKEQLAPLGIEVTVRLLDQATLLDNLYKRNFDTTLFAGLASFDDPDQVFGTQFITGATRNFSEFSDEQTDKWYDEQARTLDTAKRKEIVLNMQRRMFELIPTSMLYWNVYQLGYWKEVRDFRAGIGTYNNLKFQNVWLSK
ncbi:MAG: ABC transporter substrate-binding protein [Chloroflexi bacterium]|nr:ABC transporter substrate-binding protein [Chloroflexota bacterium]